MNCRIAYNLMQLERDGDLAAAQREELHAHCGQCAACGAEREQLLAIQGAMRGLAALTAPEEHAELAFSQTPARVRRWWLAPVAAAAVIALMVGGYLFSGALRQPHVGSPIVNATDSVRDVVQPAPSESVRALNANEGSAGEARSASEGQHDAGPIRRASVEIDNPNVITVPRRTKNPNVTIIWVYPKVELATSADDANRQPS